jgi:type I restriction enzyme M protein
MRFEEFQTEIDWWGNAADGYASRNATEQAWPVSIDEIKARNYNLDIKNPHIGEQTSHDPDELLAQYQRLMAEVAQTRAALKRELAAALERN